MDLYREWHKARTLTAEEYVGCISTHCDHIPLEEPYRSQFYVRMTDPDAGFTPKTFLNALPA